MTKRGFTLVEVVVAISVLGIVAAMAAVFIKPPIDAYFAQQRRAELTDVADTALRRMARDIRLALPNSVRTSGGVYLEFLLTRTGGRYRSGPGPGAEDPLDFSIADDQFDTLEPLSALTDQVPQAGDLVVVHNLGITGADAYAGDNTGIVNTFTAPGPVEADEDRITLSPAKQFPLESPGRRFQVVSGPVTYRCFSGQLLRYDGYAIVAAQPTPPAGTPSVLANYVTDCNFDYTSLALQARGLVALRLQLTRDGEVVTLYHEVHVNNVP